MKPHNWGCWLVVRSRDLETLPTEKLNGPNNALGLFNFRLFVRFPRKVGTGN